MSRRFLRRALSVFIVLTFFVANVISPSLAYASGRPAKSVLFHQQKQLGKDGLYAGLPNLVDTLLKPSSIPGCSWENSGGRWKVYFAGAGKGVEDASEKSPGRASRTIFKIDFGGKQAAFGLEKPSAIRPVITGDQISYEKILPGVDLAFTVATDGVKSNIILNPSSTVAR